VEQVAKTGYDNVFSRMICWLGETDGVLQTFLLVTLWVFATASDCRSKKTLSWMH
jgi:hypothetical protein